MFPIIYSIWFSLLTLIYFSSFIQFYEIGLLYDGAISLIAMPSVHLGLTYQFCNFNTWWFSPVPNKWSVKLVFGTDIIFTLIKSFLEMQYEIIV